MSLDARWRRQRGCVKFETLVVILVSTLLAGTILWWLSGKAEAKAPAPVPRWEIHYVSCGHNCMEALTAFTRKYERCVIEPIGPYNVNGRTVGYHFYVR